ncbi:transcriptional regulator [Marinactinospora thermotolerans]|uniref:DOD-type homing endonuclease domain-containing protein n=1 Tax=Marinactinospora thermotolerans DSM 45154 TaxID=1122192 RepID=A0A1T4KQW1_9ACTN|nr:hypothetical protein [Marinactinospora thermotolerans]SJZ44782.1 hypothetical protein SAMN02745673_00497 [Marinactinospora thermotolerans DSM 45154]
MHPRELVDETRRLTRQGFSDQVVSTLLGVPRSTIGNWRRGTSRAAPLRRDPTGDAYCPRCHGRPLSSAYPYLLGLYLGDGHITPVRSVYGLSITCCDDWPGLIGLCAEAMGAVLPVSVFRVRRSGCTEVKSTSSHWPCLFPQHGPGPKHRRPIRLAPWQREAVDRRLDQFVRGLFHSDGCRATNSTKRRVQGSVRRYEYPRYLFSNASQDILGLLGRSLDSLGVDWRQSRPVTEGSVGMISVAKRASVARLDEFVGPKH